MKATTLSGTACELRDGAVRELGRRLSGELALPGGAGYDEARTIWNRMIDRRPALIEDPCSSGFSCGFSPGARPPTEPLKPRGTEPRRAPVL